METDLPALCLRVWKKVPAAIPYDCEDYLSVVAPKRPDDNPVWYIPGRTHAISDGIAVAMIESSCWIWLVDKGCAISGGPHGSYRVYPANGREYWEINHADPTTCLLLAVERCHAYQQTVKENK